MVSCNLFGLLFCKMIYQATAAQRVDIAKPVGSSIGFGSIYQLDPLNNQG